MSDFKTELFRLCGEGAAEIKDAEIPKIIHRIWVGGKIESATFRNLIQFQDNLNQIQKERNQVQPAITGHCRHILWTTKSTRQNIEAVEQMKLLELRGMEIKKMDEVSDPSKNGQKVKNDIAELMEQRKYKFVSGDICSK